MYRIFAMSESGRLYELGSKGWVEADGASFSDMSEVRDFLNSTFIPMLPRGELLLDSYVSVVDAEGSIVTTFSYEEVYTNGGHFRG